MSKVYNNAGDLLVCAFKMMNEGKTKKALECAELALKLPSMRVIASGLEQMNRVHAEEDEDDVVVDEELDENIEESSDDEIEDIDIDIDEEVEDESEEASDDEESEEEIEEVDEIEESSDEEPEEDEIDEEELDEVLSSLRKQYNVKSSIVTAARKKASKAKSGCKKVKACGTKPANSGSALPMSTMAKLRGLVNKSAMKAKK
jgi:hypothetical protein